MSDELDDIFERGNRFRGQVQAFTDVSVFISDLMETFEPLGSGEDAVHMLANGYREINAWLQVQLEHARTELELISQEAQRLRAEGP